MPYPPFIGSYPRYLRQKKTRPKSGVAGMVQDEPVEADLLDGPDEAFEVDRFLDVAVHAQGVAGFDIEGFGAGGEHEHRPTAGALVLADRLQLFPAVDLARNSAVWGTRD